MLMWSTTPRSSVFCCTRSQLAWEREYASTGVIAPPEEGLAGRRDVGISRMQLLYAYRGDEAVLYLHPHLANKAEREEPGPPRVRDPY